LGGVDQDGHDALWVKDKATGTVTIVIPVQFNGSGATPDRIQQIISRDNSISTGDSNIKIQVISTDKPINGVLNKMNVSPGNDAKMCGGAGECVNHVGGNTGHIDSDSTGVNDAGPHENLHFAGLKDKYDEKIDKDGNRSTPPSAGYDETNIMSSRPGTTLKAAQLQEANRNASTKHCTTSDGKTTCN
jgi:hypothetical protein